MENSWGCEKSRAWCWWFPLFGIRIRNFHLLEGVGKRGWEKNFGLPLKEGQLMMTAKQCSHCCQLQTCLLSESPIADGRQTDVMGSAPALKYSLRYINFFPVPTGTPQDQSNQQPVTTCALTNSDHLVWLWGYHSAFELSKGCPHERYTEMLPCETVGADTCKSGCIKSMMWRPCYCWGRTALSAGIWSWKQSIGNHCQHMCEELG
jgi:hypothetical protein